MAKTATAAKLPAGDLDAGCAIETWSGPTPEHRLEQIALLHQRMSTDTPGAEEFGEEEQWNAARVRALDARHVAWGERTSVERIYTWNAVENSWMLVINDREGFATWAWVGLWTKRLA